MNGLHMRNFDAKKIHVSKPVKREMERLRSLEYPWTLTFLSEVNSRFKISYLNVCSLYAKKRNVAADRDISNVDVMFCAETRFQDEDPDHVFEIDGFACYPSNAVSTTGNRPHLGLAAYHKRHVEVTYKQKALFQNVDYIRCDVNTEHCGEVKIVGFYKHQNATCAQFLRGLRLVLSEFDPDEHQFILIGDANIDYFSESNDAVALRNFLSSKRLAQKITQPTHNMRNCIDHIYTNIQSCECGVSETYYSDHKGIWIALQ